MKKQTQDELVFLPLGGSDEVGMNLNAYGYGPETNREWLVVDVGVTFGDLSTPGVDVIVPDPTFLQGENIRGIVLDSRARGPYRRPGLAVAAVEGAGLCDAVHRLSDPRQAA